MNIPVRYHASITTIEVLNFNQYDVVAHFKNWDLRVPVYPDTDEDEPDREPWEDEGDEY